jgi:GTP-binding protein
MLAKKPEIVVLNKCDALTDEEIKKKKTALKRKCKCEVFTISAVAHMGLTDLMRQVVKFV